MAKFYAAKICNALRIGEVIIFGQQRVVVCR